MAALICSDISRLKPCITLKIKDGKDVYNFYVLHKRMLEILGGTLGIDVMDDGGDGESHHQPTELFWGEFF